MGWKELPKWMRVSIYILAIIIALSSGLVIRVMWLLFLALPILLAFTIFKNDTKKIRRFGESFLLASLFTFMFGSGYFLLASFTPITSDTGGYGTMFLGFWTLVELIIGLLLLFIEIFIKEKSLIK